MLLLLDKTLRYTLNCSVLTSSAPVARSFSKTSDAITFDLIKTLSPSHLYHIENLNCYSYFQIILFI